MALHFLLDVEREDEWPEAGSLPGGGLEDQRPQQTMHLGTIGAASDDGKRR